MAQTGYTPILIYSSSTVSQAPAVGNLTNSTLGSELAINITDGKLFYKDNANAIQVIAWKTTPTTAGGTGLTSYTAGDLLYYATGTTLSKLAIGASGRWLGSSGTAPQWNAPAALTSTNDTNVTLTLGGSASTALLNAASLTLGWTGTLAVSRGGTGTATAFTAGSVVFAGASGVYSQNNAKFFWDNTNTRLGIGTASPGRPFTIEAAATSGLNASNPSIRINDTTSGRACVIDYDSNQLLTIWNSDTGVAGADIVFRYGSGSGTEGLRLVNDGNVKLANGNFIFSTSGKGIDFSATPGTGTSELFADYEEGTWTPVDGSGASLTFSSATGYYTKYGRVVTVVFNVVYPSTANGNAARVGGLPFTAANTANNLSNGCFNINTSTQIAQPSIVANATNFAVLITAAGTSATNANCSLATLSGGLTYFV